MKKLIKSKRKKNVKADPVYTVTYQPLLSENIVLIKQSDPFDTYTKEEIDLKDTIVRQGAEGYAHDQDETVLANSKTYTDGKVGGILDDAKAYADEEDVKVKTYADEQDVKTLTSAKTYSDGKDATVLTSAKGYADGKDVDVLASAKTYADGIDTKLAGIITALTERVKTLEEEIGNVGNSFGQIFVNGAGPITASQPNDAVDLRGADGIVLDPDFTNKIVTIKEGA